MNGWAQGEGQPGLAYIFWRNATLGQQNEARDVTQAGRSPTEYKPTLEILEAAGPVAKNLGPERAEAMRAQLGLGDGDAVFFVAGNPAKFYKFAGEARTRIGHELNLVKDDRFEFCWIVDFPMFEWNEEEEDRLLAQPVLDAAGWARRARGRQDG